MLYPSFLKERKAVRQLGRSLNRMDLYSMSGSRGNNETRWKKDGVNLTPQGKKLMLAVMDDPRGIYQCLDRDEKNRTLQVFIRMCQYCIHLDFTTILGISVASLLATVFLAIAVYHLAVEERSRPAQASDKQSLLANDQLYQVRASFRLFLSVSDQRLASSSHRKWETY
uniref:CD3 gamma/delta subunit Ig-like domain-containing protein n=1 Tax=Pseudonaja textilis TaxID=8673 RepID=A0A670Y7U3_PSETE